MYWSLLYHLLTTTPGLSSSFCHTGATCEWYQLCLIFSSFRSAVTTRFLNLWWAIKILPPANIYIYIYLYLLNHSSILLFCLPDANRLYEELLFLNVICANKRKKSLQCQGQVCRSSFGKELFTYTCKSSSYIYEQNTIYDYELGIRSVDSFF